MIQWYKTSYPVFIPGARQANDACHSQTQLRRAQFLQNRSASSPQDIAVRLGVSWLEELLREMDLFHPNQLVPISKQTSWSSERHRHDKTNFSTVCGPFKMSQTWRASANVSSSQMSWGMFFANSQNSLELRGPHLSCFLTFSSKPPHLVGQNGPTYWIPSRKMTAWWYTYPPLKNMTSSVGKLTFSICGKS